MATKRHGRTGFFKGTSQPSDVGRSLCPSGQGPARPIGVAYAWDPISDTLTWGPNAPEAFGLAPKDLPRTGQAFAQWVEPYVGLSRSDAIAAGDEAGGPYDTRYVLRFGPDQVAMVQDTGRWQADTRGRPAFARGQLRIDPASSAPDLLPVRVRARSDLLRDIQNGINEALRVSQTCTLIVGSFSDEEANGLEDIARRLRPMMRRHDHFQGLGSGRFALTLTCCPASEAPSAMKRLAGLVKDHPAASFLHLAAACSPDHTFQAMKLLRFAEQALERGIGQGEAFVLYDPRPATISRDARQTPCDLVAALNDRSLILACGPVMDAQTRAPALVQACASLPGPDGRPSPLGPVPELADANLALLVDGRMLELAADYLVRHPRERLTLPVSCKTLQDGEWLPTLAAHLGARPGIESRLIIEIPEAALAKSGKVRGRLDAMKALGIGLSLAGFGTGYVSPSQLQSLPFDLLKIDGIFIQPLRRSTDDRLFVRTLIDMAQHLGIAVAAEWVDDEVTARLLASWGVDYLQGGLFGELKAASRPMTLRQMARTARRAKS